MEKYKFGHLTYMLL